MDFACSPLQNSLPTFKQELDAHLQKLTSIDTSDEKSKLLQIKVRTDSFTKARFSAFTFGNDKDFCDHLTISHLSFFFAAESLGDGFDPQHFGGQPADQGQSQRARQLALAEAGAFDSATCAEF